MKLGPIEAVPGANFIFLLYALCPMLYAFLNSQSAFRNPSLGWLGFCNSKKPQKSDRFSNKDKTYQLKIHVCYCFIGKNYLLFIFVVFLLS